jgi:glutathione synthase/RimK-type ligase-like ATP-grasp enzyme
LTGRAEQPHVLAISTAIDDATHAVVDCLERRGARVTRVETESYPYKSLATLSPSESVGDVDWGDVDAIWYRRVRSPVHPHGLDSAVHDYCCHESQAFLVGSVLASRAPVMSNPACVWAAENKLYQLRVAHDVGLRVPKTAVSNDPAAIRRFFATVRSSMIVKPLRSGYIELAGAPRAVFTSRVSEEHLAQLDAAVPCPAIYQALILKCCDVRVTVVGAGDRIFTAEIESQSDPDAVIDWRRTSNPDLPHKATDLPEDVTAGIIELMKRLGLSFGALDLVRDDKGNYWFLEINPNGQWLWLEDFLGFDISAAIAEWLISRARTQSA